MYVKVSNQEVLETRNGPPRWFYPADHATNPGELITDDSVYRAGGLNPGPDTAGWYTVSDENKPTYDPATENPPKPKPQSEWSIKSDRVVRTWNAPEAKTLAEVQNERVREVERQHRNVLDGGFAYDFGTKTATLPDGTTEPAGVRTLQTRPGDRERWQATMQVAQQYVMAGAPTELMRPFRTEDDAMVPMTAQDVADCLNAMQAFFGQALDALWTHKDAVRSLTTMDDVVAYDHTTGWE